MRFIVQFHDQVHDIDAFSNLELKGVEHPFEARKKLEKDLAGCHFVIRRVDPVMYVPIKTSNEVTIENCFQVPGDC